MAPLGIDSLCGKRRQIALRRIGDRTQNRKGRFPLTSEASCDEAFHVDRGGSGRAAQLRFLICGEDGGFSGCEALDRILLSRLIETALQRGGDVLAGPNAFLAKRTLVANDEGSRAQACNEPGADASAHHQSGPRPRKLGNSTLQGRRVAADRNAISARQN
jgi:hypothetical protein